MPGFTRTFTIAASPAAVFKVLTDLKKAPEWMPAIQKTEWVKETKVKPGAVWKEWRTVGPKTMVATISVAQFEKDARLELHVAAQQFAMDLGFRLTPDGKALTRVDYHCDGKGRGFMSLFSKMIMRSVEKQDDDLLVRLRKQVEQT